MSDHLLDQGMQEFGGVKWVAEWQLWPKFHVTVSASTSLSH
jgi:hypothetical protein